jgi:Mrp family chromosome partitioning ATPase
MNSTHHDDWTPSIHFVPATVPEAPPSLQTATYAECDLVQRLAHELNLPMRALSRRLGREARPGRAAMACIAGSNRRVGATTITLSLATAAAQEYRVAVVDGDSIERGLSGRIVPRPIEGWDDRVDAHFSWPRLTIRLNGLGPMDVFPLSPWSGRPTDGRRESNPEKFLNELRGRYDLVWIDGGPTDDLQETWVRAADSALLVCDASEKMGDAWTKAWNRLEELGGTVAGVIETFG